MGEFIYWIVEVVNTIHDILGEICKTLGVKLTDKELHFWIFGFIGIIFFFFVHSFFKWLSTISMSAISFLYVFTVLLVVVFAIEIQQKITGRGNMEFADAVMGLWGFMVFFFVFLSIKSIGIFFHKLVKKQKKQSNRLSRYEG